MSEARRSSLHHHIVCFSSNMRTAVLTNFIPLYPMSDYWMEPGWSTVMHIRANGAVLCTDLQYGTRFAHFSVTASTPKVLELLSSTFQNSEPAATR